MKYILTMIIISLLYSSGCVCQRPNATSQNKNDELDSAKMVNNVPTAEAKSPFFIINSEYENWVAGTPTGGRGTEYYFTIGINSEGLKFDSAWIDNKVFPIYISRKGPGITSEPIELYQNDTITLRISHINMSNEPASITAKPPIEYQGAVLIGYKLNNERDYFVIKELEKTKSINRQ